MAGVLNNDKFKTREKIVMEKGTTLRGSCEKARAWGFQMEIGRGGEQETVFVVGKLKVII